VIRAARLVPSVDPALIKGASQRRSRSRFAWREPWTDTPRSDTAKFSAVEAPVRGLDKSWASTRVDAHATSRRPEDNWSDAVRTPLGPAKWVRCMPVRRLRGRIHHLAERPKTVVLSAFSGGSSISEHLLVSSEHASSRCPQALPETGRTTLRRFTWCRRSARGGWPSRTDPREGSSLRSAQVVRNLHRICRLGMRCNRSFAAILTAPSERQRPLRLCETHCAARCMGDANCRAWTKLGRLGPGVQTHLKARPAR